MFVAAFLGGFTGLVMAEMADIALDAPRTRPFLLQLATGSFRYSCRHTESHVMCCDSQKDKRLALIDFEDAVVKNKEKQPTERLQYTHAVFTQKTISIKHILSYLRLLHRDPLATYHGSLCDASSARHAPDRSCPPWQQMVFGRCCWSLRLANARNCPGLL
jgi:hypothetical protein